MNDIALVILSAIVGLLGFTIIFLSIQHVLPDDKKSVTLMEIALVIGMTLMVIAFAIGEAPLTQIVKDTNKEISKEIKKTTKSHKVVLCKVRQKSDELKKLCNDNFYKNRVLIQYEKNEDWSLYRFERNNETGKIDLFKVDAPESIEDISKEPSVKTTTNK